VTHQLSFALTHDYSAKDAIRLAVTLISGDEVIKTDAFLDTGATYCIFKREIAVSLGIDVEAGEVVRVGTVTGGFDAYGHTLTLETLGYSFDITVYFVAHDGLPRNVLGRRGWLDHVRLGLVDHDGKLYLSRYND
jgi:hypothetical protein